MKNLSDCAGAGTPCVEASLPRARRTISRAFEPRHEGFRVTRMVTMPVDTRHGAWEQVIAKLGGKGGGAAGQ